MQKLPSSLSSLSSLRVLKAFNCGLTSLAPLLASQIPLSIEELNLGENKIQSLDDVGNGEFWSLLPSLRTLNLSSNGLKSFSSGKASLSSLSCLEVLQIAHNHIPDLPDEIGHLCALNTLNASFNSLAAFPDVFSSLPSLSLLSVAHNRLESLPQSLFALSLVEANFCGNSQLGDRLLPIFEMTSLERLYLSSCGVTQVPKTVGTLSNLHRLDLSFNSIASLPEEIGELDSLESINVANNLLSSFPLSWSSLYSLLELNFAHNSLPDAVPEWIQEMPDRCVDLILDLNHDIPSDTLETLMRRKENIEPPHLKIGHADMIGHRPTMEDAFCVRKDYRGKSKEVFIGLYDGHAGRGAALFSGSNHSIILSDLLAESSLAVDDSPDLDRALVESGDLVLPEELRDVIKSSFYRLNEELMKVL